MGSCLSIPGGKEALVVWDIENMHPPIGISPGEIINLIKKQFIEGRGFQMHQAVCSMTRDFLLRYIDKKQEDELIIAGVRTFLASAFSKKRDADYMLTQQMTEFIMRHASSPSRAKIILISSDADFSLTLSTAIKAGIHVQLIYNGMKVGKQLTSLPYHYPPVLWENLVKELNNGQIPEMKLIRQNAKVKADFQNKSIQTNVYELEPVDDYEFEWNYNDISPGVWMPTKTLHAVK